MEPCVGVVGLVGDFDEGVGGGGGGVTHSEIEKHKKVISECK